MVKKSRVLFTCFRFGGYHGAVIHICEISEYLSKLGYEVDVAVVTCNEKIKSYAKEKGANVFYWDKLPLDKKYDLVWAYHFPILPCLIQRGMVFKKVIAGSLSSIMPDGKVSMDNCSNFLEAPLLFHDKINLIIANSGLCKKSLIRCGVDEHKIMVVNNFVPDNFKVKQIRISSSLRKIVIVSNHVPKEVLKAADLLRKQMLVVDIYGEGYKYEPITPELLMQYDVVLTIGKTVQYALALGIPVYNYDHFGGVGYIKLENIDNEEFYIFSGKGTPIRRSAEDLCEDILSGYNLAYAEREKLQDEAWRRYSLAKEINNVLDLVKKLPDNFISADEISEEYKKFCLNIIYQKSGKRLLLKKS